MIWSSETYTIAHMSAARARRGSDLEHVQCSRSECLFSGLGLFCISIFFCLILRLEDVRSLALRVGQAFAKRAVQAYEILGDEAQLSPVVSVRKVQPALSCLLLLLSIILLSLL